MSEINDLLAKIGSMTPEEARRAVLEAYRVDPTIKACLETGCSSDQIILVLLALYNDLKEHHLRIIESAWVTKIILPEEALPDE